MPTEPTAGAWLGAVGIGAFALPPEPPEPPPHPATASTPSAIAVVTVLRVASVFIGPPCPLPGATWREAHYLRSSQPRTDVLGLARAGRDQVERHRLPALHPGGRGAPAGQRVAHGAAV